MTLSVAIIGAGDIAGGFDRRRGTNAHAVYSHAGAYVADGRFRLDMVCDVSSEAAARFSEDWNVAKSTNRLEDVCASRYDVVSVCTPDATHAEIISRLIDAHCCRVIFAEKPLAESSDQILALAQKAAATSISLVVNFQRRFDPVYEHIRTRLAGAPPIAANAFYIKGLRHNGTTMLDTLYMLFGAPTATWAYNRVSCPAVGADSVDFVLFYEGFNVTVRSADPADGSYAYHVFEIDVLHRAGRLTLSDVGRTLVETGVGGFVYGGVRVLQSGEPKRTETSLDRAMVGAAAYIHNIANGAPHVVNRPETSFFLSRLVDAVYTSLESGKRMPVESLGQKGS